MNLKKQLTELGFKQLPEFDPGYFKYRNKVGFLLLLNEKHNLSYHIHTVNATSCLESAKRVVEFGHADRGAELLRALKISRLEDWVLYFRPHGLYPGLRDKVKELLQGFRSLNVKTARIDETEPMWVYRVTHPDYSRAILISKNRELNDQEVVTEYLKKWRDLLGDALRRESLPLPLYYKAMNQHQQAMHEWLGDDVRKFAIIEIASLVGKRRGEIRNHVSFENRIFSRIYFDKLSKLAA